MCNILHRDCTEIQGCANYCDSRLSIKSCQGLFHRVVLAKKQLQSDPLEADFDFTFRILQSTSVFERILENPSVFGGILKKPQDFAKYLRIRKNFAKSLSFGRNFEKTAGFGKIPQYFENPSGFSKFLLKFLPDELPLSEIKGDKAHKMIIQ